MQSHAARITMTRFPMRRPLFFCWIALNLAIGLFAPEWLLALWILIVCVTGLILMCFLFE